MTKLAQREVVDFQIKSRTSLGINCARVSLAAHGGFTVQQARAQLCDPSGGSCVMSPDSSCAGAFTRLINQRLLSVGAVLSIVCSLFPLDVNLPTGRGHGRHPNVDRTFGAADRLQHVLQLVTP